MKSLKLLAMGSMALAAVSIASAANVTLKITGSTAFRGSTTQAIITLMGGTGNYKAAYIAAASETPTEALAKGASFSIFQGTIGSDTVTVQCSWSGSVGGIYTLTNNATVSTWIDASKLPGSNGVVNYVDATPPSLSSTYETASTADVTMSDTLQTTTLFPTPTLVKAGTGNNLPVGVVPFVWLKGHSMPTGVTNITSLQVRYLLQGFSPLSVFTGNSADAGTYVLTVGRDQDSGTRVAAFADSGYGSLKDPLQWQVTSTQAVVFPGTTLFGNKVYADGTTGYNSGKFVAAALSLDTSSSTTFHVIDPDTLDPLVDGSQVQFIGYVGTADAKKIAGGVTVTQDGTTGVLSATGGANPVLSYNGVPYSYAAVRDGSYTFWTYEFMFYRSGASSTIKATADTIANQLRTVNASADGILLSTMNVSRSVEGGIITHN